MNQHTDGMGRSAKRVDGPPALTHMVGKPKFVSFLKKYLCCVETGIIIAIEIQEGKEEMGKRDFAIDGGKASTACTLRLMSRIAGQGVVLFAHSWFASINTLKRVREQGNYFVSLIKNGHSGIPVKLLHSRFSQLSAR
jgi:hypothetical protein